jgi:hypothetical protein
MARDKAETSDTMRASMVNLRTGEPTTTPTTMTTRQPLYGRGGGRTGGSGSGHQIIHLSNLINEENEHPNANTISGTTETISMKNPHENYVGRRGSNTNN